MRNFKFTLPQLLIALMLFISIGVGIQISQINYIFHTTTENQKKIISLLNGTHKLINLEGNFSAKQAQTDRQIIKSIADSLRNTNNQTTQEFFKLGRSNGLLMEEDNRLLKSVLSNLTGAKH